jgi:hypothetical protein
MEEKESEQYVYPPDFPNRSDVIRGAVAYVAILAGGLPSKHTAKHNVLFGAGLVIGKPFVSKLLRFEADVKQYEEAGGSWADILEGTAEPIPLND